jgi:hypothetical protein
LWMDEAVERVVQRDGIGLLADETRPVFEA